MENLDEEEERKLCSLGVTPGQGSYQCRLNLGQEKYCGQVRVTRTRHMIVALYNVLVLVNNNSALALFTNI